ncbi:MAG: DUF488 domain-containing protein [Thermocladium sp.]
MDIKIKRIYDDAQDSDGFRILVDALWPRGLSKERARIDYWARDIAPSDTLRKWFNHEPSKWDEFKVRYWNELDSKLDHVKELMRIINEKDKVTLLFSAKDRERNNAVALLEYIRSKSNY